jgi:predicted transcriptional regulator
MAVATEPTIGSVIPDLLLGSWTKYRRTQRFRLSGIQQNILAVLEEEIAADIKRVEERLYLRHSVTVNELEKLLRCGILQEHDGRTYSVKPEFQTSNVTITAVEAKLKRWREALGQAREYSDFADRVFVALDGNQVKATPVMLDAFTESGVGLLLMHGLALTQVLPAPKATRITAARVCAVNVLRRSPSRSAVTAPQPLSSIW